MSVFAMIKMSGGALVPITNGDDSVATWETVEAVKAALSDHPLVNAYGAYIFDTEEDGDFI